MPRLSATLIGSDEKMLSSLKRLMKKTFTRIWMKIRKGLPYVPMH
jgi:hypothetical protein